VARFYRLVRVVLDLLVLRRRLTTRSNATLFELVCTFSVIDALGQFGWDTSPLGLFEGALRLQATRGVVTFLRASDRDQLDGQRQRRF
jgi:hypothetical protein